METENINGLRVLDKTTVDDIIAWCERDGHLTGGRVKDIEKRLSYGNDGYKDVTYKRWHFARSDTSSGMHAYCYVDAQELLSDKYVATIEVGVQEKEGISYPAIVRMHESIRDTSDIKVLMELGWNIIKAGYMIARRKIFDILDNIDE